MTTERYETTAPESDDLEVYLPGDDGYDEARKAWNLSADQRPAAVWIARTVEQVQAGLAYARERGLRVAPQVTGHSGQALPPLERTVLLKAWLHREVEVDPVARTATVRSGAQWQDVVAAAGKHGLAAMHGSSPTVGVVGYLVGGGLSFYARAHGLAVNHVVRFEVVTPDGVVRQVDADHEPELFHALRGGGGGYAVVCSVEIGLLPYPDVVAGVLTFEAEDGPAVLRAWRDWTDDAPDTMTTILRLMQTPDLPDVPEPLRGKALITVAGVAVEPGVADELERRLRAVATPVDGGFDSMPSTEVARVHGDPEDPIPALGDGMLLQNLDDRAIDAFLDVVRPGSPLLAGELRQLGGALTTPPPGAGARGNLEGSFSLFGAGIPGAPAPADEIVAYLARLMTAMQPWATGTRYSNMAERWSTLATCLPADALARVTRTKAAVDPDGLLVGRLMPPSA